MSNPFLRLADAQQNAWSKSKARAAERRKAKLVVTSERDAPMVPSPSEKDQIERSRQLKGFRQWKRATREALLAGPNGENVRKLLNVLHDLEASSPAALIAFVDRCKWLKEADIDTRANILSIIGDAIVRFRERRGLAPFNDSLFDEEPTAFQHIRKILTGAGSHP